MLKNKIKGWFENLSIINLVLILSILGTTSTYAKINSSLNLNSNINLEMGTLNSELVSDSEDLHIKIEGILPGETKSDSFRIKNIGTLKQFLEIKFDINIEDKEILKYFTYEFFVEDSIEDKRSKVYSGNFHDLVENKYISIYEENDNKFIFNPTSEIIFNLNVKLDENIDKSYSNKEFKFNINLLGKQLNEK